MYANLVPLRRDMNEVKTIVGDSMSFIERAAGALGVALSAGAFAGWIKGAIDAADEASKMAQKLGIATDKVAGLQLAFQQSGAGGPETMQKAMAKLGVELVNGNKTLEALGIRTRDSREALAQLADKFQKMPDGIDKTAAAADVFGERIGANMIPLLNAGREGLEEMDKAARDLGLTIDDEFGDAAEAFNDNMDLVREGTRGAALGIANELLPVLSQLAKALAESSKNGGTGSWFGAALATGLESVVVLGSNVVYVLKTIAGEVETIARQAKALASGDFEAAGRIRDQWIKDAQAARERQDAFDRQILSARQIAELTRNAADLDEPRFKRALDETNRSIDTRDKLQKKVAGQKWPVDTLQVYQAEQLREAFEAIDKINREWKPAQFVDSVNAYEAERLREAFESIEKYNQAQIDAQARTNEAIQQNWQRGVDQMGQSLTDALMDGGRSAAGYLQGLFRTLVLRPLLMPGAVAFSAGISGAANAATGGAQSGVGSALGSGIGSLLGGIGTFGTAAGAGISATLGGGGLGGILSGASAMLGQGTVAGISGGLGLGLGAIAPYAVGALALYSLGKKLFGKKLDDAGITGTFSDSGFSGKSFEAYSRIIGNDSTKTKALGSQLDAVFDAGALAARESVKAYADALGLPVKAIDGITKQIKFSTKGQSAKETEEEIARFIAKYADALANAYAPALKQFQKAGESMAATLERLAGLQTFSDTLADLGGVFQRVANLGVDARESFIAMAGGMDALGSKALQFVQDYYNRDEIAGIKAAEIKDALAAVGITQDVNSRDDFRRLVDGLDVSTQQGQQQLAALLDMAAGFTQVADYLAETGNTLSGAAAMSPSTGIAAAMFGGQTEQLAAIHNVSYWTEAVYNAVKQLTTVVQTGSGSAPQLAAAAPEVQVTYGANWWEQGSP